MLFRSGKGGGADAGADRESSGGMQKDYLRTHADREALHQGIQRIGKSEKGIGIRKKAAGIFLFLGEI